jgi:hypothetical protein
VPSRILSLQQKYSRLENILPEDLISTEITDELQKAKDEMDKIIEEDSQNIQQLAAQANKESALDSSTLATIIKLAFALKKDTSQDKISFQYAHWYMSQISLQYLAQSVIELSGELKKACSDYVNGTGQEKRNAFTQFVMRYSDFMGYLINLRRVITQYYDNFVFACNELDTNQKEQPLIAAKSDLGYDQLLAATKDLLLRGNRGRLAGFSSLRSAIEVYATRELFSLKYSQKYRNKQTIFLKDIPSLKSICRLIEENPNLANYFSNDTDSLKRLYDWQSIVAHRGASD